MLSLGKRSAGGGGGARTAADGAGSRHDESEEWSRRPRREDDVDEPRRPRASEELPADAGFGDAYRLYECRLRVAEEDEE